MGEGGRVKAQAAPAVVGALGYHPAPLLRMPLLGLQGHGEW